MLTTPFPAGHRCRPRSPVMRRLSTAMLLAAVAPSLPLAAQRPDSLPLKTTRTIDFTTSEGTWISLDVSPDGHTIVFELPGGLYLLPRAGRDARRLASGPAVDSQPVDAPAADEDVVLPDG